MSGGEGSSAPTTGSVPGSVVSSASTEVVTVFNSAVSDVKGSARYHRVAENTVVCHYVLENKAG